MMYLHMQLVPMSCYISLGDACSKQNISGSSTAGNTSEGRDAHRPASTSSVLNILDLI